MIDKNLNYGRHLIMKFTQEIADGSTILDIGSGSGSDLLIVKGNNPSVQLYGVECYPEYQDKLKAKGISVVGLNIEKERLPFDDESIDLIICNQVFEHLKEIWWTMHEITRVLKVNGQLIIGVPNLASLHNRLLLLLGKQPTCIQNDGAHLRGYTKSDMKKFVTGVSGNIYSMEHFDGSNFYPFPPFVAKPLARLFPSMAVTNFYNFRKIQKGNSYYLTFPREKQLETNFYLGK